MSHVESWFYFNPRNRFLDFFEAVMFVVPRSKISEPEVCLSELQRSSTMEAVVYTIVHTYELHHTYITFVGNHKLDGMTRSKELTVEKAGLVLWISWRQTTVEKCCDHGWSDASPLTSRNRAPKEEHLAVLTRYKIPLLQGILHLSFPKTCHRTHRSINAIPIKKLNLFHHSTQASHLKHQTQPT